MQTQRGDSERAMQYKRLMETLNLAYFQASEGKGKERHADDQIFEEQWICRAARIFGVGGPLFQAEKKIEESTRLEPKKAIHELLGAIVYIAAAIIRLEEIDEEVSRSSM